MPLALADKVIVPRRQAPSNKGRCIVAIDRIYGKYRVAIWWLYVPSELSMKVIGVYNLKGGSGKTTISVHLAMAFAGAGLPTVLVGMDRQGDAVRWVTGGDMEISNGDFVDVPLPNLAGFFSIEEYPPALHPSAGAPVSVVVADLPPLPPPHCAKMLKGVPADLWIVPVDGRLALEDFMSVAEELHDTGGKILIVFNKADGGGKRILTMLQQSAAMIPRVTVWPDTIPQSATIKKAEGMLKNVKEVPFGLDSPGDRALDALALTIVQELGIKRPRAAAKRGA